MRAWVLMPDHWQALLTLGERDTLSTLVGALQGHHFARRGGSPPGQRLALGPRLQRPPLPDGADPVQAARELVASPLRAGLVERLGDYPYWNAAWLEPGRALILRRGGLR